MQQRPSSAYKADAQQIAGKIEALDVKVNSRVPTRDWSPDLVALKLEVEKFSAKYPAERIREFQSLLQEVVSDFEIFFELERLAERDQAKALISGSELGMRLTERYPALRVPPQLQNGTIAVTSASQVVRSTAYLRVEKLRSLAAADSAKLLAQ